MDASIFIGNNARFHVWIVAPLVLIAAAYAGPLLYCRAVDRALVRDRALIKIVPDMEASLSAAESEVSRFVMTAEKLETPEALTTRLNEAARELGAEVTALQTDTGPAKGQSDTTVLHLALTVEGPLAAVVRMLDYLETSWPLVEGDSASLTMRRTEEGRRYKAAVRLKSYRMIDG